MITRASLRAADACYSDERIAELVPPEGLTPSQVAALGIPAEDRHWALCYAAGASDRVLRLHACWCARQALALVPSPDPRSLAAVDVAERYAVGEATGAELSAACAAAGAAWDAAGAAWAARDAAWAAAGAAWDAAGDARAAWAAAWAAARAAAWDAAGDAAWAAAGAARAAAWEAQVADLAQRLEAEP